MPDIVTDAIVLRHAAYRDYDRMLTLLSPRLGRIDAIARGARRTKSQLANAAELFNAGEYTLRLLKGRYSVTSCQIMSGFYELRLDVERLTHGAYYLALAEAVTLPDMPAEALFHLLLRALAFICHEGAPLTLATLTFELCYLAANGQFPELTSCVICGAKLFGDCRFDVTAGGAACDACAPGARRLSLNARRLMYLLPRKGYEALNQYASMERVYAEAARATRDFVLRVSEVRPKVLPEMT